MLYAQDEEIQEFSNYDELLDAFNELFHEFKNERLKNKILIKEKVIEEILNLISKTSSLNSHIFVLEKDISSLK